MTSNWKYAFRLHSVGKLHSQSMLLCIAVHGSKVPLCLSLVLPFRQTSSVLLPSIVVISPAVLMFIFTYVVSKIIESPEDLSINEVSFLLKGKKNSHSFRRKTKFISNLSRLPTSCRCWIKSFATITEKISSTKERSDLNFVRIEESVLLLLL